MCVSVLERFLSVVCVCVRAVCVVGRALHLHVCELWCCGAVVPRWCAQVVVIVLYAARAHLSPSCVGLQDSGLPDSLVPVFYIIAAASSAASNVLGGIAINTYVGCTHGSVFAGA